MFSAMNGSEVRSKFLHYFRDRDHHVVGSSSLIPHQDPTLLFTNAGMVPFKRVFTGEETVEYRRAASSQKCLRVSGKHNDLENVGRTARHHTFFEMLGNFSFGDYFKDRAIEYGWEFLTQTLGLDPARLWITVYREDDEAAEVWRERIGVRSERIVRMDEKDNFWAMGDTGPCGPCSEIHIDQGPGIGCGRPECRIGCDCDRFMELWNLVFMQFDRDASGAMTPLPKPSIDTGMGLERVTAVLQGVQTNYDTDLFLPTINFVQELAGRSYGESERDDVSMRVIADHSRAVTFLITDGVHPSNEGRGYVLRRILRRASRHARMLGLNEPFLHRCTDVVIRNMRGAYPELFDRAGLVARVVKREEERFLVTLENGLKILEEELSKHVKERERALPGEVVFKLYDTYGFPVDLTEDIARDQGVKLDQEGFLRAMEEQRDRARKAWKGTGDKSAPAFFTGKENIPSRFCGYTSLSATSRVTAILVEKEGRVERAPAAREGAKVQVITEETPFYGEGGGQVGDTGVIFHEGCEAQVESTTHPVPGVTVHHARVTRGTLAVGEEVNLVVQAEQRAATMLNHSGTHLFHAALREVLGDHVRQAGSLVAPDRLRFDFTHFAPVSREEMGQIEDLVNEQIRRNLEVSTFELPYREAIERGALAFFGDRYPEMVRVVEMGDFSLELCGGTHVSRTGEIGFFKITGEGGIAADTRRVEASSGGGAARFVREAESRLARLGELLKSSPKEVVEKVTRTLEALRETQAAVESLRTRTAGDKAGDLVAEAQEIGGVKVVAAEVDAEDQKALRGIGDKVRQKLPSGIMVLGARRGGKVSFLVTVSRDLEKRFHAGKLAKALAEGVGGRGGGRADRAEAGGSEPNALPAALERAVEMIRTESD
jgi:alanyl-tRNA synthetase